MAAWPAMSSKPAGGSEIWQWQWRRNQWRGENGIS